MNINILDFIPDGALEDDGSGLILLGMDDVNTSKTHRVTAHYSHDSNSAAVIDITHTFDLSSDFYVGVHLNRNQALFLSNFLLNCVKAYDKKECNLNNY